MKSIFYVPVYNQINEFPFVLDDLRKNACCNEILLVNNGSSDGSEELVRKSGFPYVDLDKNLGVGYSYIAALDWAIKRKFDVFGTIAANGKMLASEMDRLLNPVLENKADYVTGSRFIKDGKYPNLPLFRKLTIPLVSTFVNLLFDSNLTDATCGYRAFKLDLIKKAEFNWHQKWLYTYSFEYYIYAKILKNKNNRCLETPITMNYPKTIHSYSKIHPIIDWWAMIKPWIVARIS